MQLTSSHLFQILHLRGSPAVNGLIRITHHTDTTICLGETFHELVLCCVGVLNHHISANLTRGNRFGPRAHLKLIHQNVFARVEHLWGRPKQLQTENEQIIEVQRVRIPKSLLILAVKLPKLVLRPRRRNGTNLSNDRKCTCGAARVRRCPDRHLIQTLFLRLRLADF